MSFSNWWLLDCCNYFPHFGLLFWAQSNSLFIYLAEPCCRFFIKLHISICRTSGFKYWSYRAESWICWRYRQTLPSDGSSSMSNDKWKLQQGMLILFPIQIRIFFISPIQIGFPDWNCPVVVLSWCRFLVFLLL